MVGAWANRTLSGPQSVAPQRQIRWKPQARDVMVTQELSIHEQAVSGKQDSGEIMNLPYHSRVFAPGITRPHNGGAQPARQPARPRRRRTAVLPSGWMAEPSVASSRYAPAQRRPSAKGWNAGERLGVLHSQVLPVPTARAHAAQQQIEPFHTLCASGSRGHRTGCDRAARVRRNSVTGPGCCGRYHGAFPVRSGGLYIVNRANRCTPATSLQQMATSRV